MKSKGRTLRILSSAAVMGVVVISACAEAPTNPDSPLATQVGEQPFFNVTPGEPAFEPLKWRQPLLEDKSATVMCRKRGCSLWIEGTSARVSVPKGAVPQNIEITATALAGDYVAFEFGPHGTIFNKSITVYLDGMDTEAWDDPALEGCENGVSGAAFPSEYFTAVYYEGDPVTGADVVETFTVYETHCLLIFYPDHFSGYAMAM
jgi:hypothetical protein